MTLYCVTCLRRVYDNTPVGRDALVAVEVATAGYGPAMVHIDAPRKAVAVHDGQTVCAQHLARVFQWQPG